MARVERSRSAHEMVDAPVATVLDHELRTLLGKVSEKTPTVVDGAGGRESLKIPLEADLAGPRHLGGTAQERTDAQFNRNTVAAAIGDGSCLETNNVSALAPNIALSTLRSG